MEKFKIFFEFYPFEVGAKPPKTEDVEGIDIDDSIQKLKDKYGSTIEVFEKLTKDHNK